MSAPHEITTGRKNPRPRGYVLDWRPQRKTLALLRQVDEVLDHYADFLPLTLRQVFYALVGSFLYEKSELAYKRLSHILTMARRAQRIPFEYLRDDGIITYSERAYADVRDFHDETARRAQRYRRNRQFGQRSYIELWCEAAGMAPQLNRVAERYSVPVFSCGGFASLSAVRLIVNRARERPVPTAILHVGDLDPSGESVFEAMTADAQAFLHEDRVLALQRIEAVRVALTRDQVAEHSLPTAPAKGTDSRAARWQGGTCQAEALPPDVLAGIVEGAITARLDLDQLEAIMDEERGERAELLGLPRGEEGGS